MTGPSGIGHDGGMRAVGDAFCEVDVDGMCGVIDAEVALCEEAGNVDGTLCGIGGGGFIITYCRHGVMRSVAVDKMSTHKISTVTSSKNSHHWHSPDSDSAVRALLRIAEHTSASLSLYPSTPLSSCVPTRSTSLRRASSRVLQLQISHALAVRVSFYVARTTFKCALLRSRALRWLRLLCEFQSRCLMTISHRPVVTFALRMRN